MTLAEYFMYSNTIPTLVEIYVHSHVYVEYACSTS